MADLGADAARLGWCHALHESVGMLLRLPDVEHAPDSAFVVEAVGSGG
jgi:hypothetical protein